MIKYGHSLLNKCRPGLLLALIHLPICGVMASESETLGQAFQVHGFLTQAYVKTTENNFFGDSKDGSWDFRELGVNSSYRFSPHILASAQLLSRDAGEMYDGSLDLDYAQIDTTLYMKGVDRIGVILGRYKNPFGLYNDTRDVASTRLSIFMPQAIYWDRVRNMVLSNDGAQLFGDMQLDSHRFSLRLIGGKTPIDKNVEQSYLPPMLDPELDQDGLTVGGRLLYEWEGGRFKLAYSSASLKLDGETNSLPDGTINIDYRILSAEYNSGNWSMTAEYVQEPLDYTGFAGVLNSLDTTLDGYYLQGTYRLRDDIELIARYEESHYDKNDKRGEKTAQRIGIKPDNFYSRVSTLGLLWEATDGLILRTEFSRVDGTIFLSNLENPSTSDKSRDWNLFSLLISYSF